MGYKITLATLNGVRGINKSKEVRFNKGLTVFHGRNGSGKSSILQAVEWCLTGGIPHMRGGDFVKEDAIVNAFTDEMQAEVKLSFTGPQDFLLSRSKKRSRSTTRGKHQLIVDADKVYEDDEAENYLENVFKLNLDEVSRSKFLHQETMRDALTYKPAERSAVIEKLLGTYEVKEFTKALDQKRRLNSEIKDIEVRIERLQRDRIQFILNLRRNLDQLRVVLLGKGYLEVQLEKAWSFQEVERVRVTVDSIASRLNLGSIIHAEVFSTAESLSNANNRLRDDIHALDRRRLDERQTKNTRILKLQGYMDTYGTALEHFKQIETFDIEALDAQRNELTVKIGELRGEIDVVQSVLISLPSKTAVYLNAKQTLETEKERLKNNVEEFGGEKQINGKVSVLRGEVDGVIDELKKYSGQQRIVNLAADLIQSSKMRDCPVCSQSINPVSIVSDLRSQVVSGVTDRIRELDKLLEEKNSEVDVLEEAKENQRRFEARVNLLEAQFNSALAGLEELVGSITGETDLDSVRGDLVLKASEMQRTLTGFTGEFNDVDDKIRQISFLNQEICETRVKLRKEVGCEFEGKKLLDAGSVLVSGYKREVKALEDTVEIDGATARTKILTEIIDYLRDEERTEKAEKELPELNEQLDELDGVKTGLQQLSGALSSIRGIMTDYQKEASLQKIRELEDLMNEYYSGILGHPYFKRIKVDIEKEDPLQFSFRAASDREATYIPTRFSTAQLNVVALSIFMSNSKLMAGELPLLTFDDPTQNMDDVHKEAFARLVSRVALEFQVILATQDDETRDFLRVHCQEATFYELGEWGPEGPLISLLS